jgi:hypothetical protein
MDPLIAGVLFGGAAGTVSGFVIGVVGTYFIIRKPRGLEERAFVIRAAAVFWGFVPALLLIVLGPPMLWRGPNRVRYGALWMVTLLVACIPVMVVYGRWALHGLVRALYEDEAHEGRLRADL